MHTVEAMRIYVRIVELGGFTRAAESLAIPKASASNAVHQLEKMLGAQLLHRTTRRVVATQDGGVFYAHCKALLADLDEVAHLFHEGGVALRGRLRVDMPAGLARFIVPRLPEFLRAHPQLAFELSTSDRRVDLVRDGFDCVLRAGAPPDDHVVARQLGTLAVANCASPDYLARHGTPRSLDDLDNHFIVQFASGFASTAQGFEHAQGRGWATRPMRALITVDSADAYEWACIAGLGIIQSPRVLMQAHFDAGTLVEVLPEHPSEPMPVCLMYAHSRTPNRRLQAFQGWITTVLADHLEPPATLPR